MNQYPVYYCMPSADLVICDNLSSHKVAGVREAIEQVGASLLYLPLTARILTLSKWPSLSSKHTCEN